MECLKALLLRVFFRNITQKKYEIKTFVLKVIMSSDEVDVLRILAIADAVLGRKYRFRVRPYLRPHNFNTYQELKIEDRFRIDILKNWL